VIETKMAWANDRKLIFAFSQEAYPVRLRQVHVINVNPLVDVIFNFIKPLLKEKIKNRVSASNIQGQ
jgi:hypothetical protein